MDYKIDKLTSETINIVKFIAIILVCYIHSYRETVNFAGSTMQLDIPLWFEIIQYSLSEIIARVAVPLFFIFSAILLYKKDYLWKENIKKKVKTLVIPYIIFNTIAILTYFVLQQIPFLNIFFSKPEFIVANWNIYDWLNAYIGYRTITPMLYPLWFLRDLFIMNIFSNFIKYMVEKFDFKFLFLLFVINIVIQHSPYLIIGSFVNSLFYWSIGALIVIKQINFTDIKKFVENYHLLGIYFAGIIILFTLHYIKIQDTMIIKTFFILIGCFCLIAYVYQLNNINIKNKLLMLAQYTFPVYLLHEFNLLFFRKILCKILPNTTGFIALEYVLCPLIIVCYCIIIAFLIKKLFPKVYSVIFGQR